jgi:hypothetical protein
VFDFKGKAEARAIPSGTGAITAIKEAAGTIPKANTRNAS